MNILLRLWYLFVGEPSVANTVSNINKTIAKLEKTLNWQHLKAEAKAEAARLAIQAEKLAREEADKADRLVKKLEDFFELNK